MNLLLKQVSLLFAIIGIINSLSSCKEAGAIATPRIIDTLSSKLSIVRTVTIPPSQISSSFTFNGKNYTLPQSFTLPTLALHKMSDSSWRVSGSGRCGFQLGLTDADISIDTIAFRFLEALQRSKDYQLSGDYFAQDSLASYTVYTQLSESVNTSDVINEDKVFTRQTNTDNVFANNLIITTQLNRSVVAKIDTVNDGVAFPVFNIANDRLLLSKTASIRITRKTIGTISTSKPFAFTSSVNANKVTSTIANSVYDNNSMRITLSFSSSGLSSFEYPVSWQLVFTTPLPK